MRTDEFTYDLPPELIAQEPAPERPLSRLMVLDRTSHTIGHDTFREIARYLDPGDVLVANRSRVIPARLFGRRPSGGAVEILLLHPEGNAVWRALVRPSRKMRRGTELSFGASGLVATVEDRAGEGEWHLRFSGVDDVDGAVREEGRLPLPPYIRSTGVPENRYQTVYADRDGSIAAPTAGLHFTDDLLDEIRGQGIGVELITLHVGVGTFKPVTVEDVSDHTMHAEWGEIGADVAERLNRRREEGGRIVAVGTTTTRLLESAARGGTIQPFCGETNRFIYPGYRFEAIDALITNFHLPRSTLLMLVSAFAGRDFILQAYREAVRERYRFFSFGDAMLIR